MISKVICVALVFAVVVARPQDGHRHGHGHAFSSQSIVLHQSHGHEAQPAVTHHQPPVTHHYHQHENQHQYQQQNQNQQEYHQQRQEHEEYDDYYAIPKYSYEYKVEDPHTGDNKFHHETRDGDVVKGVYILHAADGTVRFVKYTADKHGFNAVVKREGQAKHVIPQYHHHH